jgi:hypothetical protein
MRYPLCRALSKKKLALCVESEGVGAGDRDRTGDIQLGKLTFYH